jgi:hypothetical protein
MKKWKVRPMEKWSWLLVPSLALAVAVLLSAGCAIGLEQGAQTAQLSALPPATPALGSRASPPPIARAVASTTAPSPSPAVTTGARERAVAARTPPDPRPGATATPTVGARQPPLSGTPPTEARGLPCPPSSRGACPECSGAERIPLGDARSRQEIVERARRHLAEHLGVRLEEVEVVQTTEESPCRASAERLLPPAKVPDRAYPDDPPPGLIPILHIILRADGAYYEYQSCGPWLCFCGQAQL